MNAIECGCGFEFEQNKIIDNYIRSKITNICLAKVDRNRMLHCDIQPLLFKGDTHCIVIYGFKKTVTEFVIHVEKDSDNLIGKLGMLAGESWLGFVLIRAHP